jgi:predicted CXXCH cytochrome family protein
MSRFKAPFHPFRFRTISLLMIGLGILLAALTFRAPAAKAATNPQQDGPSNAECLVCHGQDNMTLEVGGDTILLTVDHEAYRASVHGLVNCVDCHSDISGFPHPEYDKSSWRHLAISLYNATRENCAKCHAEQSQNHLLGVHQAAIDSGNMNAAVCADCHNPHTQMQLIDLNRTAIPKTCARCHGQIFETYEASVHGTALLGAGNPDVPTCVDCHGMHDIQSPTTTVFRNAVPQLCSKCHTDPAIMGKYGISTKVLDTYVADFHGATVVLFQQTNPDLPTNKPVCTDCHGVHGIASVDNPQTGLAIKDNLLTKCQRCHPDATSNFPDAWLSHYEPSPEHYPIVFYVNLFYMIFIPAVIGGMLIFVISDIARRVIERRKGIHH